MRFISNLALSVLCVGFLQACSSSDSHVNNVELNKSSLAASDKSKSYKVVGYYPVWNPERGHYVKNLKSSGAADSLTHILFAFAGVENGKCSLVDPEATYQKAYSAEESIDGIADVEDAKVKGIFGQFKKLKQEYPDIKILWSIGGWLLSPGFVDAAKDPKTFADSCYEMVHDPKWAGLFDGIDIDWEYPNTCGVACDESGYDGYKDLMKAVRERFGNQLVTTAIGANESVITAANYGGAEPYIDFYMVMTYDYTGAWLAEGPTAPHSPLFAFDEKSTKRNTSFSLELLRDSGVPSDKILLGIGFYGRGWKGVEDTQGIRSKAKAAAPGTHEAGAETYNVLRERCPATGEIGGAAVAVCGDEWWSYDTPETIKAKMNYAKNTGLGGAFFWELSGDTENSELLNAITTGLN